MSLKFLWHFLVPRKFVLCDSQYKFSIKHWLEKIWGYWIVIDWVFVGTKYYRRTDRRMTVITHWFKLTYDINHINLSCRVWDLPPSLPVPQLKPWAQALTASCLQCSPCPSLGLLWSPQPPVIPRTHLPASNSISPDYFPVFTQSIQRMAGS